jgi:hypothetical protein
LPFALLVCFVGACAGHGTDGTGADSDALTSGPLPSTVASHVVEAAAGAPPAITIDGEIEPAWANAKVATFDTQWSGAHTATTTNVRILWSEQALYMLWEIENAGFNVDMSHPIDVERESLFQEDCVEVFLAPDPSERRRYFEIELGPMGHFFDLRIDRIKGTSDEAWSSHAEIKTKVDRENKKGVIEVALRSPDILAALHPNTKLPMNMFRMEGTGTRLFLAWSPTRTPRPNFHVPEAFGTLLLAP